MDAKSLGRRKNIGRNRIHVKTSQHVNLRPLLDEITRTRAARMGTEPKRRVDFRLLLREIQGPRCKRSG